jgi:hypothetical protein
MNLLFRALLRFSQWSENKISEAHTGTVFFFFCNVFNVSDEVKKKKTRVSLLLSHYQ